MGRANVDSFLGYFTIPGASHCSLSVNNAPWNFGGSGHTYFGYFDDALGFVNDANHNAVKALMQWVEEAVAPKFLVATQFRNNIPAQGIDSQRPFCRYPERAKYVGGDVTKEASWRCP